MAITNAQQYQQLVNKPANGKRPGYKGGEDFSKEKTTAGTDNTNRGYSSNVSPSSSTAGITESNRRSGGQDASNFTGYNPNVSPSSTTADKIFNEMSTGGDTPFGELTDQEKNQINRAFFISKPSNYPSYIPPSLRLAGDFNRKPNRKYFIDNVVRAGKIPGLNYGTLSEMSEDDIEQEYKDYMRDRLEGKITASGNQIQQGGGALDSGSGIMSDYEKRLLELEQATAALSSTQKEDDEIINYRLMADGGSTGYNPNVSPSSSTADKTFSVMSTGGDRGPRRDDGPSGPIRLPIKVGVTPINDGDKKPNTPVIANPNFNFGKNIGKGLNPKELARFFNEFYGLTPVDDETENTVTVGSEIDTPAGVTTDNLIDTVFSPNIASEAQTVYGTGLSERQQIEKNILDEMADGGRAGYKFGEKVSAMMTSNDDPVEAVPSSGLSSLLVNMIKENPNMFRTSKMMLDRDGDGIDDRTQLNNNRLMAEGGRAGFAEGGMPYEGGIMDLESGRQQYFLGKLVKKITRGVKKIAKSPIGKAALGAALFKFGGGGKGIMKSLFGFKGTVGGGATPGFFGKLGLTKGAGSYMPTALGGIAASTLGSYFLTPKEGDDDDDELYAGADIDDPKKIMANAAAGKFDYLNYRNAADGGLMRNNYAEGSEEPVAKKTMPLLDMDGQEMDLREEGGFVPLGRMERADDVPARLSKNEFVFTADAVRNAGEGDVDKGAEVMYNMMKNLESGGDVSEESQGLEGAREMFQTSQRLEEVI